MATPEMEVRLVTKEDSTFKVVVYLRSRMKPEVRSLGEVNPAAALNAKDLTEKVGVMGGALAEYQGVTYGDNHDPDECYRISKELFHKSMVDYAASLPELQENLRRIFAMAKIDKDVASDLAQRGAIYVSSKS